MNIRHYDRQLSYVLTFVIWGWNCFDGEQHLAAGRGHLDCVALLVEKGAEVNVKGEPGLIGHYCMSVLLLSSICCH